MKRCKALLLVFSLFIALTACQKSNTNTEYQPQKQEMEIGAESVNAMQFGGMASDGKEIYTIDFSTGLICRADLQNHRFEVNCGDLLCDHEGDDCSARLPGNTDSNPYQLMFNEGKVYAVGNQVYTVDKNEKNHVGRSDYGDYGKIVFRNYIAYFQEGDKLVVEDLETEKQICVFEDVSSWGQGNFYYEDYLYYVMEDFQLVRLNLATQEKEVLEKKGASRASVYDGFIYYIKNAEDSEENQLIKMNPKSLEKEVLLDNVFYYNMLNDKIYYVTYPERTFMSADLNGKNQQTYNAEDVESFGWIYSFPYVDKAFVMDTSLAESCTYFTVDGKEGLDTEHPIVLW